jgi:hypothetical protein
MWYRHKSKYDYASDFEAHYKEDIKAIIEKDVNHPSVIMYSIGNEVSEPSEQKGVELTKELVAEFHKLDNSRPVTGGFNLMIISRAAKGNGIYKDDGGRDESQENKMSGMNSTMFNMITSMVGTSMNKMANSRRVDTLVSPSLNALDMAGYNYASGRYPMEGNLHPKRIIFGSETFPQDIAKNWAMVEKYPYLIGDFMWTAWDYLGEAGIGAWAYTPDGKGFNKPYPWLLADVGVLDILGNPNGELFLAQAVWNNYLTPRSLREDFVKIAVQPPNHPGVVPAKGAWRGTNAIPSWSWKGCEGNKAVVEVYSDAPVVELLLNNASLGKKRVKNFVASFKTKYAPGTLTAIAFDASGKESGRDDLKSATGKLSVSVAKENPSPCTSSPLRELIFYKIQITGENGIVESNADAKIAIKVENGKLLGFGSANPRTDESYVSGEFTSYYGQAQAVVLADGGGEVKLSTTVSIPVQCEE